MLDRYVKRFFKIKTNLPKCCMQAGTEPMTLDHAMDEALTTSLWSGTPVGSLVGQKRSRRKEKQFARLVEFQLKLTMERGLPMSNVMMGLGSVDLDMSSQNSPETSSQNSSEPPTEIVTTERRLAAICVAIPQGKCRIVVDAGVSLK